MKQSRSFSHWTPRYIVDRILQMSWMRQNPELPWLSRDAIAFIEQWLQPNDFAFEYGSGRSTIWLAQRVNRMRSIEHNIEWSEQVSKEIQLRSLNNVDFQFVKSNGSDPSDIENYSHKVLIGIQDQELDFALVDGIFRDHCALAVMGKLKPGGLLVIDDAHRYLPSYSRSPYAIPCDGVCPTPHWEKFQALTSNWRRVWFSDGIFNDAIYFKPIGTL